MLQCIAGKGLFFLVGSFEQQKRLLNTTESGGFAMPHRTKSAIRDPRKEHKDTKKEKTVKNVVSLTLTDKEQRAMERITKATSKKSAEVIREAFGFWISRRQRLCLDT
jgi:hypothetical protein